MHTLLNPPRREGEKAQHTQYTCTKQTRSQNQLMYVVIWRKRRRKTGRCTILVLDLDSEVDTALFATHPLQSRTLSLSGTLDAAMRRIRALLQSFAAAQGIPAVFGREENRGNASTVKYCVSHQETNITCMPYIQGPTISQLQDMLVKDTVPRTGKKVTCIFRSGNLRR
ncbi:hypothetical protein VTK56DRAFT_8792 [Thermocarpiscus australiensis]